MFLILKYFSLQIYLKKYGNTVAAKPCTVCPVKLAYK